MKKCAWKDCENEADPARAGSGPFDDDLCTYHDEIQAGDPPFDPGTSTTLSEENA